MSAGVKLSPLRTEFPLYTTVGFESGAVQTNNGWATQYCGVVNQGYNWRVSQRWSLGIWAGVRPCVVQTPFTELTTQSIADGALSVARHWEFRGASLNGYFFQRKIDSVEYVLGPEVRRSGENRISDEYDFRMKLDLGLAVSFQASRRVALVGQPYISVNVSPTSRQPYQSPLDIGALLAMTVKVNPALAFGVHFRGQHAVLPGATRGSHSAPVVLDRRKLDEKSIGDLAEPIVETAGWLPSGVATFPSDFITGTRQATYASRQYDVLTGLELFAGATFTFSYDGFLWPAPKPKERPATTSQESISPATQQAQIIANYRYAHNKAERAKEVLTKICFPLLAQLETRYRILSEPKQAELSQNYNAARAALYHTIGYVHHLMTNYRVEAQTILKSYPDLSESLTAISQTPVSSTINSEVANYLLGDGKSLLWTKPNEVIASLMSDSAAILNEGLPRSSLPPELISEVAPNTRDTLHDPYPTEACTSDNNLNNSLQTWVTNQERLGRFFASVYYPALEVLERSGNLDSDKKGRIRRDLDTRIGELAARYKMYTDLIDQISSQPGCKVPNAVSGAPNNNSESLVHKVANWIANPEELSRQSIDSLLALFTS